METKKNNKYTKMWIVPTILVYVVSIAILLWGMCSFFASCSPRIVEKVVTEVEYRDRVVHDTATVEITKEVEKIVTRDTVSHLENTYAKSDALVSGGFLTHSLESIPQIIEVPYEVHVTDTLVKEAQIIEKEVNVEQPLSAWKSFEIKAFWWLVGGIVLLLLIIFRKPLFALIKKFL